jgi:hypothetical protein
MQRLLALRSIAIRGKASAVLRGVRGKRIVNREALMRVNSAVSVRRARRRQARGAGPGCRDGRCGCRNDGRLAYDYALTRIY